MEQQTASSSSQDLIVARWDRDVPPREHELYARMEEEGHAPYLRGEPAGTRKPMHQHPFNEVLWVLSGWVRYTFALGQGAEASQVVLKAGDRIELPAHLPHETEVEGSAYLVYLTNSPYALPLAHHPPGVNI